MASRVLVADDSLTIQKVIGITLANSGYELVECVNEAELFKKIESNHFDLILLDFNLSDSKSGYELSKQISNAMPGAAIIVMLGTFDSIDEGQLSACGIVDKIVKPFESSKFIKKCRDLLDGVRPTLASSTDIKSFDNPIEEERSSSSNLDLWTVDAPRMNKEVVLEPVTPDYGLSDATNLDPLSSEIEGWGFSQSTQLEEKFQKSFPPVIEDELNVIDKLQASSVFMQEEEIDTVDIDETEPSFEVPVDLQKSLISEIDEEISAEDFWAVDEIVPIKSEEYLDIAETNFEEITADLTDSVHAFKQNESKAASKVIAAREDGDPDTIIHMDQDELVEKLKISLRPMIEEMVREVCRQSAEKVAWEVIPDLAENLIRKEIKDISDSVQH